MSEIKVNKISPKQTCTQLTLGDSGDTIIIPAGATITNNGTATGFGRTGTVDWDTTAKTTGFTAVSGVGYFCDTTSSAFTVTLPSSPSAGAIVAISDYANTFATNNITVGRNGSNIGGLAANGTLSTNGVSITFVYVDSTQGWIVTDSGNRSDLPTPSFVAATGGTISTCGDYKIHAFTGPGTFTVTNAGNPAGSNKVDYLVVAGGGGGGGDLGAAGGAGGFRVGAVNSPSAPPLSSPGGLPVTATAYPITVGGGGGGNTGTGQGTSGTNSIFSSITSAGGGGGAGDVGKIGLSGGSGGGNQSGSCRTAGNTPPVSPPQGNAGGLGVSGNSAGGGGGATGIGGDSPSPGKGGDGGAGAPVTGIFGSSPQPFYGPTNGVYAGGGGGGSYPGGVAPSGGTGGGGPGNNIGGGAGTAGTTNTGGGGGGGGVSGSDGGSGGSGIILIRYKFQ